jgi:YHS domain-containing protein
MEVTLRDPVYPGRVASYDAGLRVFMNQEAYFFSNKESKKRFLADPTRYSGPLTDPVTQKRFQPTTRSPRVDFRGRTYFFESDLTKRQFQTAPTTYYVRRET